MSHTDLGQPDLAALCAAAGDAEFAEAEAFEAKWREEDKARYHEERFP